MYAMDTDSKGQELLCQLRLHAGGKEGNVSWNRTFSFSYGSQTVTGTHVPQVPGTRDVRRLRSSTAWNPFLVHRVHTGNRAMYNELTHCQRQSTRSNLFGVVGENLKMAVPMK
jgi:hypothetical protein